MENKRLYKINQSISSRELKFSTMIKVRGGYSMLNSKGIVFYSNRKISKLLNKYKKKNSHVSFLESILKNPSGYINFPKMWEMKTPTSHTICGEERTSVNDRHVMSLDCSVLYGNMPRVTELPHPVIIEPKPCDLEWIEEKIRQYNEVYSPEIFNYWPINIGEFDKLEWNKNGATVTMGCDKHTGVDWHKCSVKTQDTDFTRANLEMAIKEIEFDRILNEPINMDGILPWVEESGKKFYLPSPLVQVKIN